VPSWRSKAVPLTKGQATPFLKPPETKGGGGGGRATRGQRNRLGEKKASSRAFVFLRSKAFLSCGGS